MNLKSKLLVSAVCVLGSYSHVSCFAPVNFLRTDDQSWRLHSVQGAKFTCGVHVEGGGRTTGRSSDGTRKNILALWSDAEFVNPMRLNPQDAVLAYKTAWGPIFNQPPSFNVSSTGSQGNISNVGQVGRFAGLDVTLFGRHEIPWESKWGTFFVHVLMPVKDRRIDNIVFANNNANPAGFASQAPPPALGLDISMQKVQEYTDLFPNLTRVINDVAGLSVAPVNTVGIGDLHLMVEWEKRFRENTECPYFKNLALFGKAGVAFPTSGKRHESQAFAMPLGYDGAWAIPYGVGATIDVVKHLRAGVSADFVNQLDDTRVRRLKVDVRPGLNPLPAPLLPYARYQQQQEFFLPNTGRAMKRHGFTWQINPYLEIYRCAGRVSLKAGYQYVHHSKDMLFTRDSNFDNNIINLASNLQSWHVHNVIVQTTIDIVHSANVEDAPGAPQLNFFAKIPCGGRNIIDPVTVGGQLVFNF